MVDPHSTSVGMLKNLIVEKDDRLVRESIRLTRGADSLLMWPSRTLASYDVVDGSILYMHYRLPFMPKDAMWKPSNSTVNLALGRHLRQNMFLVPREEQEAIAASFAARSERATSPSAAAESSRPSGHVKRRRLADYPEPHPSGPMVEVEDYPVPQRHQEQFVVTNNRGEILHHVTWRYVNSRLCRRCQSELCVDAEESMETTVATEQPQP